MLPPVSPVAARSNLSFLAFGKSSALEIGRPGGDEHNISRLVGSGITLELIAPPDDKRHDMLAACGPGNNIWR